MSYSKVENYMGSPTITVDGKPLPPMAMTITTQFKSRQELDLEYIKKLGQSGIKLFYVMCDTDWYDSCSFSSLKKEMELILSVIEDAHFMLRMSVHPPKKWVEENPDEVLRFNDGSIVPVKIANETVNVEYPGMYSFNSKKWQKAAGDALVDMMEKCDKLEFADRIVGYLICAGRTSEWNYGTPIDYKDKGIYGDASPSFMEYFSDYVGEKYNKKPDEVILPDCEKRFYAWEFDRELSKIRLGNSRSPEPDWANLQKENQIGSFLNVDEDENTADFYRAWQLSKADALIELARRIKEKDSGKITGALFGGWAAGNRISGAAAAIRRVLNSPYVDFLSNPGVYDNRQPGGFTGQRAMVDSFFLKGKTFIVEDDMRSHKEIPFWRDLGELFDANDTINTLKREFGRNICDNTHAWWFDQFAGGGRYKFQEAYDMFKKQSEIADFAYSMPRVKQNEIAFIYDEESVHTVSNQTMAELVEIFGNYEIARIGAPSDRYYHNDLSDPNMPDYKLYVFLNTLVLTKEEREVIKNKLRKNGAMAVFVYAPGVIDPSDKNKQFSAEHITDLTGIKCEMLNGKFTPAFKVCDDRLNLEYNKVYGLMDRIEMGNIWTEKKYSKRSYLYPAFFSCDDDAKVLARFCENKKPAITIKNNDGFTSVLYGAKLMRAEVVKEFAKLAGCHIYNDTNDVIYANKNFLTVHSSHNGKTEISLPEKCDIIELYENKVYGKDTDHITFDMYYGETKMFYLKKSE